MFDESLLNELRSVFSVLDRDLAFEVQKSSHASQAELLEFLSGVASTSSKIQVKHSDFESAVPRFQILDNGAATGVWFSGIPTGHEFTSLIVAVLNASQKGRMPDDLMQSRIARLRGPVRLKTYISLTCENCPDVVQALNQMALIHPDFEHEMIDGQFAQADIERLSIQGVPSVIAVTQSGNDSGREVMISSGKIGFLELLQKLEQHFGVDSGATNEQPRSSDLGNFDVVVVGGGPAGASAAIYAARKGFKTVLLAEKMGGQVQDTKGIENLISVPYTEGPLLAGKLAEHLRAYPIQVLEHRRVQSLVPTPGAKPSTQLTLESGETLTARAVIVATGAKWREMGIPGEKEYLGRGVAFCPHCDGPYYKGKKVAVIGGGNSGVEAAIDLAGIVREVVVFEYNDRLKADQVLVDKLKSLPNTSIVLNAKTAEVVGDGNRVNQLKYQDRASGNAERVVDLDGVFVQIGLLPNSQFLKGVVELTSAGEIVVDAKGRTSVPGIYAAGDVTTTPFKQIIIAMGEGAKTALTVFEDLSLK